MSDSTRRTFFKSAAAAAIATQAHPILGANDRVAVGIVGLGGRGNNHMDFYLKIPAANITVVGRGESQPLVQTADGVREPQNRRVEIVLQ